MNNELSKAIKKTIILEVDRYISCASTNEAREEAYPRKLLEQRLLEQIDRILSSGNY